MGKITETYFLKFILQWKILYKLLDNKADHRLLFQMKSWEILMLSLEYKRSR